MAIIVNDSLYALVPLKKEGVQIKGKCETISDKCDLLKIVILNLMPTKHSTEVQLLRLLDNNKFEISVEFIYVSSHQSKTTPEDYIKKAYKSFDEIRKERWDGMIITGAPVELLDFKEVDYWEELTNIMDWTLTHVSSTFFICWGAQAALYHFYQIPKYKLSEKMFGVFYHSLNQKSDIIKDFQDPYLAPHSRHTEIKRKDIESVQNLKIISESREAGVYITEDRKRKQLFVSGHSEYDINTLEDEYFRDVKKGLPIKKPANYFPGDNDSLEPIMTWRNHATLLFNNWLNYYVSPLK